jgi:cell division protein FtsZ
MRMPPPVAMAQQQQEAKKPTLFERMIGPRQAEPQQPAARQPMPQQTPRPVAPAPQPAQQANLGIESAPRAKAMKSEEEILDIPAFLRRQAN